MNKIENTLLKACGYTVLILFLFYLFCAITNVQGQAIAFPTFLIILGFSLLIALAGLILSIKSIKYVFRVLIHYATLLLAFVSVFMTTVSVSAMSSLTSRTSATS